MSVSEHKQEAPKTVNCFVLTVSDTRTKETDKSGALMKQLLEEGQYCVTGYEIVKDSEQEIQAVIKEAAGREDVEAILINGGTGIASRDRTYEAVSQLLEKEMPGFGDLFRYLSYVEDIGSAAMLSRAVAGIYQDKAIFSTPGSSGAVRLAMTKLIVPELGHVMREIYKDAKAR
ncbi:MogA/MoaB family molybdenum cofactor biosynthesis protein [Halalkalibacter oceani]|uniref:Molybdenum cofactor biosynthesis protein B n=1 Tax=Halalkalibacter oceani TaxID=1653776 RepID=A0A9X2DMX8_9BACI|nr:molybdenum cofactor biosynthesis protein B [Halalkalibacter oceani]MCM3713814.1 molybdenum cofactor biosynthesis protein MoaB [Halalkalibacter oceani]